MNWYARSNSQFAGTVVNYVTMFHKAYLTKYLNYKK
jgi:hypothetical protein